jgi:hypothetical protein
MQAAKAAKVCHAAPLRVSALVKVWLEKPGFWGGDMPAFALAFAHPKHLAGNSRKNTYLIFEDAVKTR